MKYGYDSGAVRYIGRWGRYREGMVATACGSQMEVAFRGRDAVLHFDPTDSLTPSHFYIQVDGGARVETVADYTVHIRCAEDGEHVVRVMLKGGGEIQNRWEFPLQCKIHFLSFEADGGNAPADHEKADRADRRLHYRGYSGGGGFAVSRRRRQEPSVL